MVIVSAPIVAKVCWDPGFRWDVSSSAIPPSLNVRTRLNQENCDIGFTRNVKEILSCLARQFWSALCCGFSVGWLSGVY